MSNRRSICGLSVDPKRTRDSRSICGLRGKPYLIRGGLGSLQISSCKRHAERLEKLGFEVLPLTPLEESAFKNQQPDNLE